MSTWKTPSIIRYHPNTLKSCFLIYPSNNLITNKETTNATSIPIRRTTNSKLVKSNPNLINFNNKIAFDSIIQTTTGFNIIKNNNIFYQLNTTTKTLSSNTKTYYYTNYESKDNVITLTIYNDIIYIDTQYNKILFYSDIINYSSIALKNLLIYCVNTFYILLKPLNDIMQTTISKLLSNPNTNRTFNIFDFINCIWW